MAHELDVTIRHDALGEPMKSNDIHEKQISNM
jgi:hypothetical protein